MKCWHWSFQKGSTFLTDDFTLSKTARITVGDSCKLSFFIIPKANKSETKRRVNKNLGMKQRDEPETSRNYKHDSAESSGLVYAGMGHLAVGYWKVEFESWCVCSVNR